MIYGFPWFDYKRSKMKAGTMMNEKPFCSVHKTELKTKGLHVGKGIMIVTCELCINRAKRDAMALEEQNMLNYYPLFKFIWQRIKRAISSWG